LLERTGDQWEVNTATWHIAFSQYRLGQLDAAVATAQRVHRSGIDLGDHQAAGIALGGWSKAAAGDVPEELIRVELDRVRDDVHASAEVLQAEAMRLLRLDRPTEAVQVLEQADRLVRGAGLRQEYVSPVVAWLATAQRLQVEALGPWVPARRRRALRQARRTSRRARRTARWYRNNLPHALREAGLLAALAGQERRSRVFLDRSLTVAIEQGARHEQALTKVARGRAGAMAGWAGADRDREEGEAQLAELRAIPDAEDVAPTLSLVDRLDRLLDEGRRVASALTADSVFHAVSVAAEALLRPQACRVFDLSGKWDDVLSSGGQSDDPMVSRTLVERALEAGHPVCSDHDLVGDPGESMLLSASRSALAAPIYVRGRAVALLYVTHDEVGSLYQDGDEQVAQFLTAIAGAALENAEGFAEVQALTYTLEQRVAERTQALAIANRDLDRSLVELRFALDREKEVAERLRTLDELKNEFVAMVAHDLRSPMTSISAAADMLENGWEGFGADDREMLLGIISRSTKGLSGLVEDVLQVARIESGQFSYELAPFDLGELVTRTVQEIELVGDKRVIVDLEDGLPNAFGDRERNWQVLTNLVSNAVKFSPDGALVRVAVAMKGRMLQVAVTDNGPGISSDDLPRLFQKFSRIRTGDVRGKIKGTGLGLYICQRIVEAQGGSIWAKSRLGEGSMFVYTVPASQR
jgi:two-component system sensor kinase